MGGKDKDKEKEKGSKKSQSRAVNQDLKREEVLQALILADSFDQRFTPITLEKPR
jgi:translation initiation factor eIF-2B subunit epsilon